MCAHHIGQHYIRHQSVSNNGDLWRRCYLNIFHLFEVLQDLILTAWFLWNVGQLLVVEEPAAYLGIMSKHFHARILFQDLQLFVSGIISCSGSVGHDQQSWSWVCFPQFLEFILSIVRLCPKNTTSIILKKYLIRFVNFIGMWFCKAIIFIQDYCPNIHALLSILDSKSFWERDRQVVECWDCMMRQAQRWIPEQFEGVEGTWDIHRANGFVWWKLQLQRSGTFAVARDSASAVKPFPAFMGPWSGSFKSLAGLLLLLLQGW